MLYMMLGMTFRGRRTSFRRFVLSHPLHLLLWHAVRSQKPTSDEKSGRSLLRRSYSLFSSNTQPWSSRTTVENHGNVHCYRAIASCFQGALLFQMYVYFGAVVSGRKLKHHQPPLQSSGSPPCACVFLVLTSWAAAHCGPSSFSMASGVVLAASAVSLLLFTR